jgi:hypothetical protein
MKGTIVHQLRTWNHRRAGVSRTEVIVIVVICVAVGMLLLLCLGSAILLPALGKARATARQIKDSTQVRGLHQGMVLFAQNNNDQYPLPSRYDKNNTTILLSQGQAAASKDTTNHVMSILIYSGFFPAELCVSPAEQNGSIVVKLDYAQSMPGTAALPQQALWDPSFSADFSNGRQGNTSFAQMHFRGARGALWGNTFGAEEAAIGNRGPEIAGVAGRSATPKNLASMTFFIHAGRSTWEGNIGYNDNHVNFETTLGMDRVITEHDNSGKEIDRHALWDCLFFDDAGGDPTGTNNLLTIITTNGDRDEDVTTIWD